MFTNMQGNAKKYLTSKIGSYTRKSNTIIFKMFRNAHACLWGHTCLYFLWKRSVVQLEVYSSRFCKDAAELCLLQFQCKRKPRSSFHFRKKKMGQWIYAKDALTKMCVSGFSVEWNIKRVVSWGCACMYTNPNKGGGRWWLLHVKIPFSTAENFIIFDFTHYVSHYYVQY